MLGALRVVFLPHARKTGAMCVAGAGPGGRSNPTVYLPLIVHPTEMIWKPLFDQISQTSLHRHLERTLYAAVCWSAGVQVCWLNAWARWYRIGSRWSRGVQLLSASRQQRETPARAWRGVAPSFVRLSQCCCCTAVSFVARVEERLEIKMTGSFFTVQVDTARGAECLQVVQ